LLEEGTTKKKEFEALFPAPFFSKDQIRNGLFIVYLAGIVYSFLGIALVT